ncbi:NAD(P)/FAD-dependent oxidoreductase [Luedemannella helvata]|uniref:NAD(P)/FAD-dependent oxidoreductase n=1 Tax=Luedemannella helvata TaxID=349315 RepID=A0ABN2KDX6_9ACTN
MPVGDGQSVAGVLMAGGVGGWRTTRGGGRPRGLFCGIGACFDCLITVDGVPHQRACQVPARAGMVLTPDEPGVGAAPTEAGSDTRVEVEVAVVGAGPAGMAAAGAALGAGCSVALVDAGTRPGGQFWRHREGEPPRGRAFGELAAALDDRRLIRLVDSAVWFAEAAGDEGFRLHTTDAVVTARRVVIATGAYDRVLPFPGWDLPGVVTAGGAQALLKASGVPVGRRVVVAGAGPFLLPVAAALAEAGTTVPLVAEAGDPRRYAAEPAALLTAPGKVVEGARYAATFARHRVRYRTRRAVTAAHGDGAVEAVTVSRLDREGRPVPGDEQTIPCDAVAVSFGFVPQLELALALGCGTRLDVDGNLVLAVGADQRTTVDGVYAAGEVTGVGGWALAVVEGQLAGAAAAGAAARTPWVKRRARLRRFATAMHRAHRVPAGWTRWVTDATLVCRCEEVTAGAVRAAVTELGATDARAVKLLARPGMGWCQGRMCGHATACLTAQLRGREPDAADLAAFAHRPLAQPVTLGELAGD